MESTFLTSFAEAAELLDAFRNDPEQIAELVRLGEELAQIFEAGGKAMAAGNGGSMADAMHFAEEWTGRFRSDRQPYPALALSDPTHLTCVSNDFGFVEVFSRMVDAFGKPGDLLVVLSTSGNSENLVRAAETARRKGVKVAGFLGRGGGALKPLCDFVIMAPGRTSDRIQEIHMAALHILIEAAEIRLREGLAARQGAENAP